MKSHDAFHPATGVAILAAIFSTVLAGRAQAPSVSISPGGASATVAIHDAQNRQWILEQSTNGVVWTDAAAWKVYNGSFHGAFTPAGPGAVMFFRARSDESSGIVPNTVENALLLPGAPFNYAAPVLPPNFLAPVIVNQNNTPATNLTTDVGATLGRVLFYDKRLSANQTVSCASCHQQQHGFSDPRQFSVGFEGGLTGRNSMGLTQARYYPRGRFFWDERAATLEEQVLQPIQNSVEMGMTLPALETRLQAEPFYTNLFQAAFGSTDVTSERISKALAQFVRSIISTRTKFDAGVGQAFANFTAQENLGRQIFNGQIGNATCVTCHGTDNFVPNNVFNNGLENPYIDKGIGEITGQAADEGKFKINSLRNVALTAPYMHDGRFATLEEVVEFYNSGVVDHPNLAPQLRVPPPPNSPPGTPPGPPRRLNLTVDQKAALVAFLRTLTDTNLVADPKFSDPFNYGN